MKQNWWILVIVLLVLTFGLIETPIKPSGFLRPLVGKWIGGLTEEAKPTPTIQPDVPTLSQDEVCALVYNYLEAKGNAMTSILRRRQLLDWFGEARPYFTASYQGNGKWQVWGVGNDGVGARGELSGVGGGLWNVYEKSGIVEPANDKAKELLSYIQWCTR